MRIYAPVGDGTYAHSAILAVRACVAAGATMTYKVLYNGAVAMTGGQGSDTGVYSSPLHIAAQLLAEGVREVVIVAEMLDSYQTPAAAAALRRLAPGVSVVERARLDAVQQRLRGVAGVTAIIYDQDCATEKRRKRKVGTHEGAPFRSLENEIPASNRGEEATNVCYLCVRWLSCCRQRGRLPPAAQHLLINHEVCEGCGDCGVQSNCVAIVPKDTALGRKRAVDPAACNSDLRCAKRASYAAEKSPA